MGVGEKVLSRGTMCRPVPMQVVPISMLLPQVDDSIYVVQNGQLEVFLIEPVSHPPAVHAPMVTCAEVLWIDWWRVSLFFALLSQDGSELPLKEAGTGESVHSLLSIMEAIVGQPNTFKHVFARAARDTYVLQ